MNKEIVLVAVITYNSSKTILETLQSIKNQSYGSLFLELVISDDGSVDNTKEVVEDWLFQNENSFFSAKLLTNENGGVSENCNRCIKNSTSDYIKILAGDDALMINAIEKYISFAITNKSNIIFSKMRSFNDDVNKSTSFYVDSRFFKLSVNSQLTQVALAYRLQAPAAFIARCALDEVGLFDPKHKLFEDLPIWSKLLKSGNKFYFINEELVLYRTGGISRKQRGRLINEKYEGSLIEFLWLDFSPHLPIHLRLLCIQDVYVRKAKYYIATRLFKNKYSTFNNLIFRSLGAISLLRYCKKIHLYYSLLFIKPNNSDSK